MKAESPDCIDASAENLTSSSERACGTSGEGLQTQPWMDGAGPTGSPPNSRCCWAHSEDVFKARSLKAGITVPLYDRSHSAPQISA